MRHVAVIKKFKNEEIPMVRVTQVGKALARGFTAMGNVYQKGDLIMHLSSGRSTGEVFTFTKAEILDIYLEFTRTKYHRRVKPSKAAEVMLKIYKKTTDQSVDIKWSNLNGWPTPIKSIYKKTTTKRR